MGTKYGMVLIGALFSMLISPSFQETQEIVLTDEEKEQIVSEHNAYRKTEGSSNMRYMVSCTNLYTDKWKHVIFRLFYFIFYLI